MNIGKYVEFYSEDLLLKNSTDKSKQYPNVYIKKPPNQEVFLFLEVPNWLQALKSTSCDS